MPDGSVWYTAQVEGIVRRFDPKTGKSISINLGPESTPFVIVLGPDGGLWTTDRQRNEIDRVDPRTHAVRHWKMPKSKGFLSLNSIAFDKKGRLWFTGQNGFYGRLEPKAGAIKIWDAPRGHGTYGIIVNKDGNVWFASLAGSYIARVNPETGAASVVDPPQKEKSEPRRLAADSKGRIWVSEWASGKLAMYDPATGKWTEWSPPVKDAELYAIYIDQDDKVWISEWASDAIMRFDPETEKFESFKSDKPFANIGVLAGRKGEIWAAEPILDRLAVVRY